MEAETVSSPRLAVAALEQKIRGRAMGPCVYLMQDELDQLFKMAHSGAAFEERQATMIDLLRRGAEPT